MVAGAILLACICAGGAPAAAEIHAVGDARPSGRFQFCRSGEAIFTPAGADPTGRLLLPDAEQPAARRAVDVTLSTQEYALSGPDHRTPFLVHRMRSVADAPPFRFTFCSVEGRGEGLLVAWIATCPVQLCSYLLITNFDGYLRVYPLMAANDEAQVVSAYAVSLARGGVRGKGDDGGVEEPSRASSPYGIGPELAEFSLPDAMQLDREHQGVEVDPRALKRARWPDPKVFHAGIESFRIEAGNRIAVGFYIGSEREVSYHYLAGQNADGVWSIGEQWYVTRYLPEDRGPR
jgi:hypothetical protein